MGLRLVVPLQNVNKKKITNVQFGTRENKTNKQTKNAVTTPSSSPPPCTSDYSPTRGGQPVSLIMKCLLIWAMCLFGEYCSFLQTCEHTQELSHLWGPEQWEARGAGSGWGLVKSVALSCWEPALWSQIPQAQWLLHHSPLPSPHHITHQTMDPKRSILRPQEVIQLG